MTHTFTDREYENYLKYLGELDELREWKDNVISGAKRYMESAKESLLITNKLSNNITAELACWHDKSAVYKGYCDWCPLGWIFPKCPLGREKNYSK
jgi:hypothetical protein